MGDKLQHCTEKDPTGNACIDSHVNLRVQQVDPHVQLCSVQPQSVGTLLKIHGRHPESFLGGVGPARNKIYFEHSIVPRRPWPIFPVQLEIVFAPSYRIAEKNPEPSLSTSESSHCITLIHFLQMGIPIVGDQLIHDVGSTVHILGPLIVFFDGDYLW